ncbi:MAG: dihydropteroate synthase [Lentisphaerae bacterium RIFOXYB12_FULL_65_16]|nr:MAG: dihydropteroate synthase [Lentisphaerae bacterium RIFOXYA12_64_32]OGV85617.1 MAG: dihydropteroate synthase [Lentisphaerae bacterium RIFOXYB12_FULL_65_16]
MLKELPFEFRGTRWMLGRRPLVMGILNVTPDSFSDGGQFFDPTKAVEQGLRMVADGADLIDIGGESTRPGAAVVGADEETQRVVPVIAELSRRVTVALSIDTWKADVARAAITAGAAIVNDVSGLHRDPKMLGVVRETGVGCVLMHMRGEPATMQKLTTYADLIGDIRDYFRETLARAATAGVPAERFILDPGIGFAKTAEQNLVLINRLAEFRELDRPVLAGPSRKSFIGALLPGVTPPQRGWGTAASVACCVLRGADIIRVHDVKEMREVATVTAAIRDADNHVHALVPAPLPGR